MKKNTGSTQTGFTLTEVLVVLAILMGLLAILLPVLAKVRENGRSATCQSNLKQIALAIQQYTQDSDGRFPNDAWAYQISSYLKRNDSVRCPTRRWLALDTVDSNQPLFAPDYLYNTAKLSRARHDSRGSLLFEGEHEATVLNTSTTFMNADEPQEGYSAEGSSSCGDTLLAPNLHSGGGNFSFVDGHVKWLTPDGISEMECSSTK